MAKHEPEITTKRIFTVELHEDDYWVLTRTIEHANKLIDEFFPGMSQDNRSRLQILSDRLVRSENL